MKHRIIRTAAILMAAVLLLPGNVRGISAEKAILMDAQTGRVIYEQRCDERSLIASTTKIMTALVVCQQCNVLDRMKIPKEAVGIEGSSMYLREGEVLTIQDLLYGLMLSSGNDAAVALAIYCGGTVEGFAELMNDKARAIGLDNSHFMNPNGLDEPGHYSTARDLAILTAYAMEDPVFAQTVSTKQVKIGDRYLTNHNKLLWQVEGAEGVKTGFTKAAGRILVSSASREGRRLICVTINAPSDWQDHAQLLNRGFEDFSVRQVVTQGQTLGYVEVIGGDGTFAELTAGEDFSYALAAGEEPEILLSNQGFVYAPVAENAEAGMAYVTLEGKKWGRFPCAMATPWSRSPRRKSPFWKDGLEDHDGALAENNCIEGCLLPPEGGGADRRRKSDLQRPYSSPGGHGGWGYR